MLLLCGYKNGHRRLRGQNSERKPVWLPEPTWFVNRLQAANLDGELREISSTRARGALNIDSSRLTALVRLSPGVCFAGRLTPWPQEAELLWQYFHCPLAAFSVIVKEALRLEQPVSVASARGSRGNVSLKHALFQTNAVVLDDSFACVSSTGARLTTRDVAHKWGLPPDMDLGDVPCLWTPDVILKLILLGRWENLVLRLSSHAMQKDHNVALRWLRDFMHWPSEADVARLSAHGKAFMRPPARSLSSQDAQFLLSEIRGRADSILTDSTDPETTQISLEQSVEGLQTFLLEFQPTTAKGGSRRSTAAKSAEQLINAIRVARHVRNKSKLGEIQGAFLEAILPPSLHDLAKAVAEHRKPVSGAAISKSQARLALGSVLCCAFKFN